MNAIIYTSNTGTTKDEDAMLDMMHHGANHVSENNRKGLLEWYESLVQEA